MILVVLVIGASLLPFPTVILRVASPPTLVFIVVYCNACGGVGHLTKDCRQRRPGEIWSKSKNTYSKEIDEEYDNFLKDMGVKRDKNEFDSIPNAHWKITIYLTVL